MKRHINFRGYKLCFILNKITLIIVIYISLILYVIILTVYELTLTMLLFSIVHYLYGHAFIRVL